MNFVILRNTVSGRTHEYEAKMASKLLAHPVFGRVLVEVDKDKPEVLSPPHLIDDDGSRIPVDDEDGIVSHETADEFLDHLDDLIKEPEEK